jgi:hypothetical protein
MAKLPVRERILVQVEREFVKVQEGVNEHLLTWNTVVREPLEDVEQLVGNAISITEGPESNSDEVRSTRKTLELITEFWIRPFLGDVKSTEANLILGDVQRTIREALPLIEDSSDCQLAIDIVEVRNELELGMEDLIGGVVLWNVVYRHSQEDPRVIGPGH